MGPPRKPDLARLKVQSTSYNCITVFVSQCNSQLHGQRSWVEIIQNPRSVSKKTELDWTKKHTLLTIKLTADAWIEKRGAAVPTDRRSTVHAPRTTHRTANHRELPRTTHHKTHVSRPANPAHTWATRKALHAHSW